MSTQFYVDLDALYSYADFLNKCMNQVNSSVTVINKANVTYQNLMHDDISKEVDLHIRKLKKVFDNFSVELNKMSKNVKEDYVKYQAYLKPLK